MEKEGLEERRDNEKDISC